MVFNHDICPVDETRYRVTVGEVDIDFREHGIIAWAFGHFHSHFINEHDGVLNIGTACADTGGIDSSVAGIRKVTISNGKVSSEVIPFRNEVEAADAAVWSTDLGAYSEYCSPISYNGDVIAATVDNGYPKKCGVYRLNGENGEIKWSFKTRNSVCNDMAIDGGCLYLQDTQLRLYCLDVESGELLWHVDMENIVRPMYSRMNVLIVDDVVIGGSQYMLYAFNKKSGELVWKYAAEKVCEPSPALLLHDKKRNQLILSRHWKDLRALDLDTREVKWSHKDDMMFFRTATPLISEDIIYTCGLRKLHKFDIETGELLVCADAPCVMDVGGSPALDGDVIYYPTATMGVIAFELPSFRQLRRFETENVGVVSSPYRYGRMQTVEPTPRIFGDTLVFASNDGCVYFYNKETAELERKICVGSPILSSPIFEDGYMTVLDFDGRVSKFKL